MTNHKKEKIITLIISIVLTALIIFLYFLDQTREWDTIKISSCVIISIWVFFIPPTCLYYFYKIKNSGIDYSFKLGTSIGINGLYMFLISPVFGLLAYSQDLDQIK